VSDLNGPGVPDLGRIIEKAQGPQDPWGFIVTVNGPGGPQQMPVSVGLFVMLGDISGNLAKTNELLEQLSVALAVKP
jgi:hypothetical protein